MKARVTGFVLVVVAAGAVAMFGLLPNSEPKSGAGGKCGSACKCLPPCPCERGGECLQDEPHEPPCVKAVPIGRTEGEQPTKPARQACCNYCSGTGTIDGPLGSVICPHCPAFSTRCKDKHCPVGPPGEKVCPVAPSRGAELVAVREPYTYRYGLRGRRSGVGYRTVTMTRAQFEERHHAAGGGSRRSYGGCRSCR